MQIFAENLLVIEKAKLLNSRIADIGETSYLTIDDADFVLNLILLFSTFFDIFYEAVYHRHLEPELVEQLSSWEFLLIFVRFFYLLCQAADRIRKPFELLEHVIYPSFVYQSGFWEEFEQNFEDDEQVEVHIFHVMWIFCDVETDFFETDFDELKFSQTLLKMKNDIKILTSPNLSMVISV